jgi:hypothetical protein
MYSFAFRQRWSKIIQEAKIVEDRSRRQLWVKTVPGRERWPKTIPGGKFGERPYQEANIDKRRMHGDKCGQRPYLEPNMVKDSTWRQRRPKMKVAL